MTKCPERGEARRSLKNRSLRKLLTRGTTGKEDRNV